MTAVLLLLCALLTACAAPRDQVVLLAVTEAGGQLTVQTSDKTLTLDAAYQTAQAQPRGRLEAGLTTAAQVQARYGAVLATLPAAGRLWTLRFATGATTLEPESQAEVPALLVAIAGRAAVEVLLEGHTDQTGEDADNDALSLARAEAVRDLLVAQGLTATFVRVVGRGARSPLVNAPGQDEPQNRRVEVLVR
jgi:outer membrane protein OmpA-like peptidoglycan-associated protein